MSTCTILLNNVTMIDHHGETILGKSFICFASAPSAGFEYWTLYYRIVYLLSTQFLSTVRDVQYLLFRVVVPVVMIALFRFRPRPSTCQYRIVSHIAIRLWRLWKGTGQVIRFVALSMPVVLLGGGAKLFPSRCKQFICLWTSRLPVGE